MVRKDIKKIVTNVMDITKYTYDKLKQKKHINIICKPELNIISFTADNMDVDTLKNQLLKYGWVVSVAEYPHVIRLVIMPHVKKDHIDKFLIDLNKIINI